MTTIPRAISTAGLIVVLGAIVRRLRDMYTKNRSLIGIDWIEIT